MLYRGVVTALGAVGSVNALALPEASNEKRYWGLGCLVEEIVEDIVHILHPVTISTYITKNTVMHTAGHDITVHNAPTHFKTVVTETLTSTQTSTKATASPTGTQKISTSISTATSTSTSTGTRSSSSASSSIFSVDTSAAGTGLNTAVYTATSTYPGSSTVSATTYTTSDASTTKVVSSTTTVAAATTSQASGEYTDWTTFVANGVNLGNWLEIELSNDQYFWNSYVNGTTVTDEWTFCETLGDECGTVMEEHYATYVTTETIDKLAAVGVNFLRIPTTYAAWIDLPGSEFYHGDQQTYLKNICDYAISTYGMRVVVGLHSLPGGVNELDIGEAYGHDGWFFNETNLEYSYNAVSAILTWIEASDYPWAYTIGLINEASDNFAEFASANSLTTNGTEWIVKYVNGSLDLVAAVNEKIPIMLQDCFLGEEHWSGYFEAGTNMVIDTHIYYFAASGIYSEFVDDAVCGQAAVAGGDNKFPVFIGEWSLQVLYNNSYDARESIFNTQRYAWSKYVQGGSFWGAAFNGTDAVDGEGVQRDYWSYIDLIDAGVISKPSSNITYC